VKITESGEGIVFTLHVQPRASKCEICGIQGDELKIRLTAPPVDDAANKLCVEFLAKAFGIAKSRVTIVAGQKSRHKTVRISGATSAELLELLS
jgi:uncharacterized protein (TIGR00251 family)